MKRKETPSVQGPDSQADSGIPRPLLDALNGLLSAKRLHSLPTHSYAAHRKAVKVIVKDFEKALNEYFESSPPPIHICHPRGREPKFERDNLILKWKIKDGLSHGQIGNRLHMTRATAQSAYQRALHRLRDSASDALRTVINTPEGPLEIEWSRLGM